MQIGFLDPQGPRRWRILPYAAPIAMLLFAIYGPLSGMGSFLTGVGSFGLFHMLGLFTWRQKKPRNAELECGPGYVDIKKTGVRNQRIHAKDITGASTARNEAGRLLLTLQHKGRVQPITLELEGSAEVDKVRHALGIGHGGFGTIGWSLQANHSARTAFGGRLVAVGLAVLALGLALVASAEAAAIATMMLGLFGFVGAILGLQGLFASPAEPNVVMGSGGLRLRTPLGWFALPYEAIHRIDDNLRNVLFTVPQPYNHVGVDCDPTRLGGASDREREVLRAQIMAAVQRARGMGPQKTDVTGRVDMLRRNGESPRDWLVRLDMAGQMLSAGVGYRGATLDTEDLWAILEDPEAEPELRAGAARVLRHAPNTRVRIDTAVAAIRDESTNRRLRIAVDDNLDGASHELSLLDHADATPQEPQQQMYAGLKGPR